MEESRREFELKFYDDNYWYALVDHNLDLYAAVVFGMAWSDIVRLYVRTEIELTLLGGADGSNL